MNKTVLSALVVLCLITSCKTKGVSDIAVGECELFKIGNFSFYNPRVYERPIMFQKGSHTLLYPDYLPVWYAGYCAENLPSYFKEKSDFIKHIYSKKIAQRSLPYYDQMYEANKNNLKGAPAFYHDDFFLVFRGTVSVKNLKSNNEYLLVSGKSYIADESDYDKNTDFYEKDVKSMFAFILEDGVYKFVDVDLVMGNFSKYQNDKVLDILNAKTLVETVCVENVNNVKKIDFDSSKLPKWVYNKSELDEE
ncbi:hypothetical protein ACFFU9_00380 [Mariniflexile ostreae]|uniref:DKNYY family protein n=1 Tax=Mariniflexile ostreae TaxID=1520892 RepID=A0ABV5F6W2_9FLAO